MTAERERGRPPMTIYDHLAVQLDRNTDLEALVQRLWTRIEAQNILLNSALHELAAATERPPGITVTVFVNTWYRDHGRRF
jgi:hypothetical protein